MKNLSDADWRPLFLMIAAAALLLFVSADASGAIHASDATHDLALSLFLGK